MNKCQPTANPKAIYKNYKRADLKTPLGEKLKNPIHSLAPGAAWATTALALPKTAPRQSGISSR
jgi:hypothetical protein